MGYLPTTLDIIENPKKLKFAEIDTPQLTRTLSDPNIYLSIINNNFSSQVGLLAKRDGLFMENTDSPYVNLIVARAIDKDNERLKNSSRFSKVMKFCKKRKKFIKVMR